MKRLILIKESPFSDRTLELTWRTLKKGDTILFIQDGVIFGHVLPKAFHEKIKKLKERGVKLMILEPDLKLRGLRLSTPGLFETVDYEKFARLVEESEKILA